MKIEIVNWEVACSESVPATVLCEVERQLKHKFGIVRRQAGMCEAVYKVVVELEEYYLGSDEIIARSESAIEGYVWAVYTSDFYKSLREAESNMLKSCNYNLTLEP